MSLNKTYLTTTTKAIPRRGPTSSEDMKEFVDEVVTDLAQIRSQINDSIQPVLDSLPGGNTVVPNDNRVSYPNVFSNGLDGSQMYIDNNMKAGDINASYFYDSTNKRPRTLKEVLINFMEHVDSELVQLENRVAEAEAKLELL